MLQHLTRGIGLLEEAELNSRRDTEQMARTLAEFRQAVQKVQGDQRTGLDHGKSQRGIDTRGHHASKTPAWNGTRRG